MVAKHNLNSACIATLVRFKNIRDFSISEDLTCKQKSQRLTRNSAFADNAPCALSRYDGPTEYLQLHRGLSRLYLRVSSNTASTATADRHGDALVSRQRRRSPEQTV
jgi:hypothetical protein